MKITKLETLCLSRLHEPERQWITARYRTIKADCAIVVIHTDEGVTGYGECSDGRNPYAVTGAIEDFKPLLLGADPRAYEMRFWDLIRGSRQSPGGIAAKAIAGIELALIDIKAKALGISVVELFGGPTREEVRLYWSHCGTTRLTICGFSHTQIGGDTPVMS